VDTSEALSFLRENHRAVLATTRRDSRPQLSPVMVALDADSYVVVSTRETAMKTTTIAREPRVSLCVLNDEFFGPWVMIDGFAEIIHLPDALEPLVDYYRTISGEHPDWDDYREAMKRERRVLVRIRVDSVGPNRAG
jgi:PPOX class probable F420-dependent enzyme